MYDVSIFVVCISVSQWTAQNWVKKLVMVDRNSTTGDKIVLMNFEKTTPASIV